MRIVSWNVNGLRACARKGFVEWLHEARPDFLGVQEVRARLEQLPGGVADPEGYHTHFISGVRAGYSGVGLFSRRPLENVDTSLGEARFDEEARLQIARLGRLLVANVYFPNGSGKERSNSRVPFKLDFYRALFDRLQRARRCYKVLVMGDFNTARRPIDLARPRQNEGTSGFLPEERAEMDRWIEAGWIDTFRHFEKGPGHYSWWSQRLGARARNVGWRIDYVLASPAAMKFVRNAFILPDIMGSDHCPVGIVADPNIMGRS